MAKKKTELTTIKIFDTTLRDGEQSPGASMNIEEKLRVAKQLQRLNVDVIEAGFPIASEGDFEAVKKIAQTIKRPEIAGLCRAQEKDIDGGWGGGAVCRLEGSNSYSHRHFRHSYEIQAGDETVRGLGCRGKSRQKGES